jgi:hypothetical protein
MYVCLWYYRDAHTHKHPLIHQITYCTAIHHGNVIILPHVDTTASATMPQQIHITDGYVVICYA